MNLKPQRRQPAERLTRQQWEEQLKGRPCYAGADLMLMWDLAALVLLFPWGRTQDERRLHQYRVKPYFFLPQVGFEVIADVEPAIINWRDSGYIDVTPGNFFDEETFVETVLHAKETYDLRGFAYDPKYAQPIALRLRDGHGVNIAQFNQSGITFAPCVDHFEKAVTNHVFYHDGNPVMTWCSQNVTAMERPGNLKLLKKPIRGNHKKIDGIVAAVMAMGLSLSEPEITSIYEEEGALFG